MNTKSLEVIFWLLLLSFIFNPAKWQRIQDNAPFLILMLQYPIINILRIYFTPAHDYEIISSPAEYEMWVYCIIALFLATAFFDDESTRRYANLFIPISITLTLALAAYHFHIIGVNTVKLWNSNVFEAPLFASTIAFMMFHNLIKNSVFSALLVAVLIGLTVFLCITYAGTRGILIAQIVSLFSLLLLLLYLSKYKATAICSIILILSVVSALWIDIQHGGSFVNRMNALLDILSNNYLIVVYLVFIAMSVLFTLILFYRKLYSYSRYSVLLFTLTSTVACVIIVWNIRKLVDVDALSIFAQITPDNKFISDLGISERMQFWSKALDPMRGNLLVGLGAHIEPHLVKGTITEREHLHVHNAYLSWLIWGGFAILISGLIWLVAPVIAIVKENMFVDSIPSLIIALFWSISLIFDSFFSWKNFTYVYIILVCLSYELCKSQNNSNTE